MECSPSDVKRMRTDENCQVPWQRLISDVLALVFAWAISDSEPSVLFVCKHWMQTARSRPRLWEHVSFPAPLTRVRLCSRFPERVRQLVSLREWLTIPEWLTPHVQHLKLQRSRGLEGDWSSRFPSLHTLTLQEPLALPPLSHLPASIKTLNVHMYSNHLVVNLPAQLEHLDLRSQSWDASLFPATKLRDCPRLRTLKLFHMYVHDIDEVGRLPLRELRLESCVFAQAFSRSFMGPWLSALAPTLEVLDLGHIRLLTDADLSIALPTLDKLRVLVLTGTLVTGRCLEWIASTQLERLELDRCGSLLEQHLVKHLPRIGRQLKHLTVGRDIPFAGELFRTVSTLSQLRVLIVSEFSMVCPPRPHVMSLCLLPELRAMRWPPHYAEFFYGRQRIHRLLAAMSR